MLNGAAKAITLNTANTIANTIHPRNPFLLIDYSPLQKILSEEEAIALANGITEEEAIALASSGGSTVDRQAARAAVAGAFREELGHAMEPGAKVMSADRELRYCLELQRDRIARKNIRFTEEFDPGKKPVRSAVNNVRSWQDGHYETS